MKKTAKPGADMDAYIRKQPKDVQPVLKKMKQVIQATAPALEPTITYGIPTFKLDGKNVVHFGGWKTHIGFYPTPSAQGAFKKELAKYERSKGTVRLPLDKPMPYGLIRKIVRFRVKEAKASKKKQ